MSNYFKSTNIKVYPSSTRDGNLDYPSNITKTYNMIRNNTFLVDKSEASYMPIRNMQIVNQSNSFTFSGSCIVGGYVITLNNVTVNISPTQAGVTSPAGPLPMVDTVYIYLKISIQDVILKSNNIENNNTITSYELSGVDSLIENFVAKSVTQGTFESNTYYTFSRGIYTLANSYEAGVQYYIKQPPIYTGAEILFTCLNNLDTTTQGDSIILKLATVIAVVSYQGQQQSWTSLTVLKQPYIEFNKMQLVLTKSMGVSSLLEDIAVDDTDKIKTIVSDWLENDYVIDDGQIT